jgi:hypothetical protein
VDLDWINHLMSAFDWSSKNLSPSDFPSVLPVQAFDGLVLTASKILHKEPNCLTIEPDEDLSAAVEVVVVGDVHGQYHDVLFLLQDAGFPSENRFFVFNGDYVDRGAWGLETFLLLLAWKVYLYLNSNCVTNSENLQNFDIWVALAENAKLCGILFFLGLVCLGLCLVELSTYLPVGGRLEGRRVLQFGRWCPFVIFGVLGRKETLDVSKTWRIPWRILLPRSFVCYILDGGLFVTFVD